MVYTGVIFTNNKMKYDLKHSIKFIFRVLLTYCLLLERKCDLYVYKLLH